MQRKTYAVIDGNVIKENIKEIKRHYPDYKYYIGVVKNNAYHHGIKCVTSMIEGGINYFAVSSLEEAISLRNYTDFPILILEPIAIDLVLDAINLNLTITVDSLDYAKKLVDVDLFAKLKVHLAVDSGMNRLGIKDAKELKETYSLLLANDKINLEGLYTHFATSGIMDPYYDKQLKTFKSITSGISLKDIPIVHLGRSLTLVTREKLDFVNGIRLGIIMYGLSLSSNLGGGLKGKLRELKRTLIRKKYKCSACHFTNNLKLKTAFSLYSSVMAVRRVYKGDNVGYNTYKIKNDGYIITIPIGYADGVTKDFKYVSYKGKKLPIVSDSSDMLMVFSEDYISVDEKIEIFGANISVLEAARNLHVNTYHLFNQIQNRVLRIHKNGDELEEIFY